MTGISWIPWDRPGPSELFHRAPAGDPAIASVRRGLKPPFPRRIRRVNRKACARRDAFQCRTPDSLVYPRDDPSPAADRFCGPCGPCRRGDHLACAAGACADRQYLFRSAAAAGQRSPWRRAATGRSRRRRRSTGIAARPPVADAQPAAAGPGRAGAGSRDVAAACSAAGHHRRSAKSAAPVLRWRRRNPTRVSRLRRPAPTFNRDSARQQKGVPQPRRTIAAGRRGGDRAARRRRSSTRRRASRAWTRSPAASSISTKTSARRFSSARCA